MRLPPNPRLPPSLWPHVWSLASRKPWPPVSAEDAARFVAAVDRHRLLAIAANDPTLPPAVGERARAEFARVADARARESADYDAATEHIARALPREGWAFVKGTHYRACLYGDGRQRPMNDIDVLVQPGGESGAVRALEAAGCRQQPSGFRFEIVLEGPPPARLPIDIYMSLLEPGGHEPDFDEMWRRRLPFGAHGFRLADPHAVVYQALLVAVTPQFTHVRRYLDLWLLLGSGDAVIEEAVACARRWRAQRAFYWTMRELFRVFPEAASGARRRLVETLASGSPRRLYERLLLPPPAFGSSPSMPAKVVRRLALLDSSRHRLGLLLARAGGWPLSARAQRFRVEPQSLGFKPSVDPDRLNQSVDELEAEEARRKLAR